MRLDLVPGRSTPRGLGTRPQGGLLICCSALRAALRRQGQDRSDRCFIQEQASAVFTPRAGTVAGSMKAVFFILGSFLWSVSSATPLDDCKQESAEDCTINWFQHRLEYDNGTFTGSIWTNTCPYYNQPGETPDSTLNNQPDCKRVEIGPENSQLPSRGNIAWSTHGVNIYGPFEAGFGQRNTTLENGSPTGGSPGGPYPCFNEERGVYYGYCASGVDVVSCEESLFQVCTGGEDDIRVSLFLDDCGGHAKPYHYHNELSCYYDHSVEGHSPIVGIALDGRGVYGIYETQGKTPEDLDACNGHFGPVPANDEFGIPSGERNKYHYHTTLDFPFTLGQYLGSLILHLPGCYGPKDLDECEASDKDCDGELEEVLTPDGGTKLLDTYCSCRREPSGGALDKARIPEPINGGSLKI